MTEKLKIVVLGLSLSSTWGNGHATTYRALLRGLRAQGHRTLFLERDMPWYAAHRDLADPEFCTLSFYHSVDELRDYIPAFRSADAVIIGSYVPEGREIIDLVHAQKPQLLCFYDIDTPVTLSRLDAGEEEHLAARQVPLFDLYFSFAGGGILDELETRYAARRAVPLYCSVDVSHYFNTGEKPRWDLSYLGTYSPDRQATLERMLIEPARRLPRRRFVVAGPQYPNDIDWPDNVERIDHLGPADHASFYSRSRFTLNVTRADMRRIGWAPSVRLFEAAACMTPVVSDRWKGLSTLLPEGKAVLVCDTTEEVVDVLTRLPEKARRRIALCAHERIASRHTGAARAVELVGHLCDHRRRPLLSLRRGMQPAVSLHTDRF